MRVHRYAHSLTLISTAFSHALNFVLTLFSLCVHSHPEAGVAPVLQAVGAVPREAVFKLCHRADHRVTEDDKTLGEFETSVLSTCV